MKIIITLTFLFTSCIVFGQRHFRDYDFSKVDHTTLDRDELMAYHDSLYKASSMDSIMALIHYRDSKTYSPQYISFNIGLFAQTASLKSLNRGLVQAGLDEIGDVFATIPFGFSFKGNRWMGDYFVSPVIRNKVEDDTRRLDVNGASIGFSVGYDLLHAKRFQLYPQAGLSYDLYTVKSYNRNFKNDVTQVDQLFNVAGNTSMTRRSLNFNYGLELDYFALFDAGNGVIVGFVYGMSVEAIPGKFKIERDKASLDLNDDFLRQSYFGIVLKMATKDF
ncbi:hypothetical protein [Pseudochryseolinea flava]|nr:hypothetical protein [Pseudochryseolinea flava]